MRFASFLLLACAGFLSAQTTGDPEVRRAEAEVERLRKMVELGAAPRAQLEKAEAAIADVQDSAILRRTLYGSDLSEGQADEMMAAAERRLERRKTALEQARKLVDLGAVSRASLETFSQDVEAAQKEKELAQSRVKVTREVAAMAAAEEALMARLAQFPGDAGALADRFDGDGVFSVSSWVKVEAAFERQFGKPLPVSAMGETAVHRSMGFDHAGRVDVAVHPDTEEGSWLLAFLANNRIPYFAFRQAVPGKATGAHIHIGPASNRIAKGG